MVKKKDRLPIREFFLRQGKGAMYKKQHLSLRTKKNHLGMPRIGVTITTSVEKKATMRNFWKRKVLATARHAAHAHIGTDMLFIFNTHTEKKDAEAVVHEVRELVEYISHT